MSTMLMSHAVCCMQFFSTNRQTANTGLWVITIISIMHLILYDLCLILYSRTNFSTTNLVL